MSDLLGRALPLTASTNGAIERVVSMVGDDRILLNTGASKRGPGPQFGWGVWGDLPAASRARILGGNFHRLLAMRSTQHEP